MNETTTSLGTIPTTPAAPKNKLLRSLAPWLLAAGAATAMAACQFNQIYGVAQLAEEPATGILDTNHAGDRVYVGTIAGGDRWNAVARIRAIDPATGLQVGATAADGGALRFRAVAVDPGDDTVWLLRDNGTLEQRTRDLALMQSLPGFFLPPAGPYKRYCDLEAIADRHFVATGVYQSGATFRGFMTHTQMTPVGWQTSTIPWPVVTGGTATSDTVCPRVSYDKSSGKLLLLKPNTTAAEHRVAVLDKVFVPGSTTLYNFAESTSFAMPVDAKFLPGDLTAEYGYYVTSFQHATDLSDGFLRLYEDNGALHDAIALRRARSVDFSNWPAVETDAGSMLFWGGNESDTGQSWDLGAYSFTQ